MQNVLRKKRTNPNLMSYIVVLLTVLASKTVYFGTVHWRYTTYTLLVTLVLIGIKKNLKSGSLGLSRKQLTVWLILCEWLLLVSLFYIFEDPRHYIGALVQLAVVLLIGCLIVINLNKTDYIKCYVQILFVICSISLFYFFLTLKDQTFALQFASTYDNGESRFIALPWYTFGWNVNVNNFSSYSYIFGRNAGPFWEPGAFQGFILIAICMLLRFKNYFKHKGLLMVIFLVTMLTTQSTAGYIALLITFLGFGKDYVECLYGKFNFKRTKSIKFLLYTLTVLFCIIITYIIVSSGNISNKFNQNNGSYISRNEDVWGTLKLLLTNPFIGVGMGETGQTLRGSITNTNTTTTLLTLAMYFGIPFMGYYLYRFIRGCNSLLSPDRKNKVVLAILFVIILMSETLYLLPVYAVFLYTWNNEDNGATTYD